MKNYLTPLFTLFLALFLGNSAFAYAIDPYPINSYPQEQNPSEYEEEVDAYLDTQYTVHTREVPLITDIHSMEKSLVAPPPGQPIVLPPPPPITPVKKRPKDICNGEIAPALDHAMRKTFIMFNQLSWGQKKLVCNNPWSYATKFDFILPTCPAPCGTLKCQDCYQVGGFRRFGADINYLLMGLMMNLCNVHHQDMDALVIAWKGVMYARFVPESVWYWLYAGYEWDDGNYTIVDFIKKKTPPNRHDKNQLHCLSCQHTAPVDSIDSPLFRIWKSKIDALKQ